MERGENYITEFNLKTGSRVDVIDLDRKGRIAVVEVKSAVADFRSNRKWIEYLEYCDIFSPSTRISRRRYCRPTAAFYHGRFLRRYASRTLRANQRQPIAWMYRSLLDSRIFWRFAAGFDTL